MAHIIVSRMSRFRNSIVKDSEETVERLRLTISKYETGRTERQAIDVETSTRKDVVIKKLRKELTKKDALIGRERRS